MRESVDSLCRDGADTPISLNKSNGSELPNVDAFSDKQPALRVLLYTALKVHNIYSYSDSRLIVKLPIVHLHLLSSNSVQMLYHPTLERT